MEIFYLVILNITINKFITSLKLSQYFLVMIIKDKDKLLIPFAYTKKLFCKLQTLYKSFEWS